MQSKQAQYDCLVAKRKACRLCDGLVNPAGDGHAHFDSNHIGPWSCLQGDLDAQLMIVGQDWGDLNYYKRNCGRDDLTNPTMRNLEIILNHIGINACLTEYSDPHHGLFLTNAILCLKDGGLQANVDPKWFNNCGKHFLRQQIEIIRPKVLVGLGQHAYHAVLRAFGHPTKPLRQAVEDKQGVEVCDGVSLFAAYHCGARTVNINRKIEQQKIDWERIQVALRPQESTLDSSETNRKLQTIGTNAAKLPKPSHLPSERHYISARHDSSSMPNFCLSNDELVVLFEFLRRFTDTEQLALNHPAEAVVLDNMASQLERILPEPFQEEHAIILEQARANTLTQYESLMGPNTWIHDLPSGQDRPR